LIGAGEDAVYGDFEDLETNTVVAAANPADQEKEKEKERIARKEQLKEQFNAEYLVYSSSLNYKLTRTI
jgi:hypothetical protein